MVTEEYVPHSSLGVLLTLTESNLGRLLGLGVRQIVEASQTIIVVVPGLTPRLVLLLGARRLPCDVTRLGKMIRLLSLLQSGDFFLKIGNCILNWLQTCLQFLVDGIAKDPPNLLYSSHLLEPQNNLSKLLNQMYCKRGISDIFTALNSNK